MVPQIQLEVRASPSLDAVHHKTKLEAQKTCFRLFSLLALYIFLPLQTHCVQFSFRLVTYYNREFITENVYNRESLEPITFITENVYNRECL